MKAVVMAGGHGSRLAPLKGKLNKHALPVYDRPMIVHVVERLVEGGIDEVLILLNLDYPETILEALETGERFGCNVFYRYIKEADGPGRQLYLAEPWVKDENFIIMLGDSLYLHPLSFHNITAPHIWTMPLDGSDDPSKYGQVLVDGDRVLALREKPKELFSNIIQTATWCFPSDVFDKARALSRGTNGEVHVGMLSEEYVREGRMTHTALPAGSYIDLGTPDALLRGANMVKGHRKA